MPAHAVAILLSVSTSSPVLCQPMEAMTRAWQKFLRSSTLSTILTLPCRGCVAKGLQDSSSPLRLQTTTMPNLWKTWSAWSLLCRTAPQCATPHALSAFLPPLQTTDNKQHTPGGSVPVGGVIKCPNQKVWGSCPAGNAVHCPGLYPSSLGKCGNKCQTRAQSSAATRLCNILPGSRLRNVVR